MDTATTDDERANDVEEMQPEIDERYVLKFWFAIDGFIILSIGQPLSFALR